MRDHIQPIDFAYLSQQWFAEPCQVCFRRGVHSEHCDHDSGKWMHFKFGKYKGKHLYSVPLSYIKTLLQKQYHRLIDKDFRNEMMRRVHLEEGRTKLEDGQVVHLEWGRVFGFDAVDEDGIKETESFYL